jgi:hypothetical protein
VSRYAATYAFFRADLPAACDRLRSYAARAAAGQEEPATARALAAYLCRGLDCGATSETEVTSSAGLTRHDLTFTRRHGTPPTPSQQPAPSRQ